MAEGIEIYDAPPDAGYRITELHVWIGTHTNGGEGILSMDLSMPFGIRHTPLVSSKRDVAERFAPFARKIQREAMHRADCFVKIELRTFKVGA
jgi:hypothetical protein